MKIPDRLLTTLLIAILAAGLMIGARWWSSLAPKTGGGDRSEFDAASLESRAPRLAGLDDGSLPNPTTPKPAKRAVQKRDALLESLRSKLEAANAVPNEALLTFRSEEARDRFAKQAAAYGLEILGTIPQLNTARVRYGRLEDLRDSIAASSGDFANVEGNAAVLTDNVQRSCFSAWRRLRS